MTNSLAATGLPAPAPAAPQKPEYNKAALLTMFEKMKKESFADRWIWEREWLRDIYYTANRQWIYWHPSRREWVDKRLTKNVPRPVTNKIAEIVQSLRASFGAIELGIKARPIGHNPKSVATAETTDRMSPLLHEEHNMNAVMREADFWFIVTGNACLQMSWDVDKRFNRVFIAHEKCLQCGENYSPKEILDAGNMCPVCGGTQFEKAMRPDGTPEGVWEGYGKGKTTALSPFEYALPPNTQRFDEAPYIIRLRWRDKSYYEANHPDIVGSIMWENTPMDRSLQIFKSLATMGDVGTASGSVSLQGGGSGPSAEGVTEYELWMRPSEQFPEGFVMRVVGDRSPQIIDAPDEGLPGPLPYKDIDNHPLFPFGHAPFEHLGGRIYGRSAISPVIQKQDQLNQLDSLIQMIVQRVANPVWIIPEGAGIDHFTGDPGLVMKYNPLAAGGQAKPERIAGENVPSTLFQLREQYLRDIEELSGTFDVIKGQKPSGVEAFSALQLLVERSQARFTSAFGARGEMYRTWFKVALELERAFGPDERTLSITSPNRGYTFESFNKAQLSGSVSIHVEDGTNVPKTPLGKRAAIEHANQLALLTPDDSEQKYAILSQLGLSDLVPSIDVHVQSALQEQDKFERWLEMPEGPPPLSIKPWYDASIHKAERIKWLNGDTMRDAIAKHPMLEQFFAAHLQELDMIINPPMPLGPDGLPMEPPPGPGGPTQQKPNPPGGVGAGRAMRNSNRNSGSPTIGPQNQSIQ